MIRLGTRFLDMIYPRHCAVCGDGVGLESHCICWDCMSDVSLIQMPHCALCGNPADGKIDMEYVCSLCISRTPKYDAARSAARYREPLQSAIQAFKYNCHIGLCEDFSRILLACVDVNYRENHFDAVTFVPLTGKKGRERTYNQSELLAGNLAKKMNLPLMQRCLYRVGHSTSQTGLTAAKRRKNVKGVFEARNKDWIQGRRLLLVDDVMTTGATASEAARVLKDAGAVSVHVVTIARG